MTTPDGPAGHAAIVVHQNPYTVVTVTGPTEAAVFARAAAWLEDFGGAVLIMATNWRGNVSEDEDVDQWQMDLAVDMSIAISERRWPRDWFRSPGD